MSHRFKIHGDNKQVITPYLWILDMEKDLTCCLAAQIFGGTFFCFLKQHKNSEVQPSWTSKLVWTGLGCFDSKTKHL